jgi:hypothetical protein
MPKTDTEQIDEFGHFQTPAMNDGSEQSPCILGPIVYLFTVFTVNGNRRK